MNEWSWNSCLFKIFIAYSAGALLLAIGIGWLISYLLKRRFFSRRMIGKVMGWWLAVSIGIGISAGIDSVNVFGVNCFSDYMGCLQGGCKMYAEKHNGIYPTYGDELEYPERVIIGSKNKRLICPDTDAPYEWSKKRYTINDPPNNMLFWCGKPHKGIFVKWRNVGFIGYGIQRVPEKEFQRLLKEQQGFLTK